MILRCLVLIALLGGFASPLAAAGSAPEPPSDLKLVFALTKPTERPPSTAIFAYDVKAAARTEVYRDADKGDRVLLKIAGSDLLGAGRCFPPGDLYVIIGPPSVQLGASPSDYLSRLTLGAAAQGWQRLLLIPLSFSDASPYGLWNRAPIFAISPGANRIAFTALRVGSVKLDRPAIRVMTLAGAEEWQIPLPSSDFTVTDLAWSPDGSRLAYCLLPLGDEHTLDESLLPKAGVYVAEMAKRTASLVYPCYGEAIAWGPKPNRIAVAVHSRDIWSPVDLVQVVVLPVRQKVEEFSVPGSAQALAYADGDWLAVQVSKDGRQEIWVYPGTGGLGRRVYERPEGEGRLALLGWARAGGEAP